MSVMGSARAQQTVRRLQEAITSGRWPVNSKIPTEADLAAELGVGRSTVREAVRSLAHLGMLEPAPGRGTFVRSLNPVRGMLSELATAHSWADILAVRKGLEVQAAELAARHADPEALARLRAAHEADKSGGGDAERGESPGQFHSLVVEMAGNGLLAELYAGLMAALRTGIRDGRVHSQQDDVTRHGDHEALLAAIAAGNPAAAAAVWAAHAERDITV